MRGLDIVRFQNAAIRRPCLASSLIRPYLRLSGDLQAISYSLRRSNAMHFEINNLLSDS